MMYLKLFYIIILFINLPLKANEVQIIELYKNKSLDQLVLETNSVVETEEGEQTIEDDLDETATCMVW